MLAESSLSWQASTHHPSREVDLLPGTSARRHFPVQANRTGSQARKSQHDSLICNDRICVDLICKQVNVEL